MTVTTPLRDTDPARNVDRAFRAAMRRIAATVTIVTAHDGERHHGMTATAVTSLSMAPPSLLVCINKKTFLHDIMLKADSFCVNVLHQDHAELSAVFSGALTLPKVLAPALSTAARASASSERPKA